MLTILTNAQIYTADEKSPWADTVVIDGEKISYVGSKEGLPHGICEMKSQHKAREYDMQGKMIIPGIIDSHVHPAGIAKTTWHVKLPLTYDLNNLLRYIKQYAEQHSKEEKPFLYFEYYPTTMFGESGPWKGLLDQVVSDRPCLVQDFGEHMAWVNSKMLEALEVSKDTPDPDDLAVFVRDEDGEPTGFIKEMAWKHFEENLYRNIGWRPPVEMTEELIEPVIEYMLQHGVTAMADGFIERESELQTLAQLEQQGKLKIYYDGYVRCDSLAELPDKLEEAQRYQRDYGGKHIKINTMKIFLDGTNEGGNAYLVESMENDPEGKNHGKISMSREDLTAYFIACNEKEFDIHIHIVGDGAFRTCCDAMEEAQKILGEAWCVQLTLAHCELIHPEDMLRPAGLGIRINWTPRWAGGCYGEQAKKYLGEERWNTMYQFIPLIQKGISVAFSSDVINWGKIERANPFYGMQIGHTRVDIADPLDPTRFPGSVRPPANAKLPRDVLLSGSTIKGAEQMRWSDIMGSIESGKLANLVVLSDDFFEVDAFKISDIRCEAVIFEGKLAFGALTFQSSNGMRSCYQQQ